jgi:hypothetical protein
MAFKTPISIVQFGAEQTATFDRFKLVVYGRIAPAARLSIPHSSMTPLPPTDARAEPWTFPRKVLLVAFALLLALMGWQLLDLIMLTFGAVIVATVLRALAMALERHARVPTKISVVTALLLVMLMIEVVAWFVGEPLAEQFEILRQRLPAALGCSHAMA